MYNPFPTVWLNECGASSRVSIFGKLPGPPHTMKHQLNQFFIRCIGLTFLPLVIFNADLVAQDTLADSTAFTLDGYVLGPSENIDEKIKSNLFIKTILSKRKCFEGEAIEASYYLYTRLSIDAKVGRKSGFNGFSTIDMTPDIPAGQHQYRWHNGKVFKVYAIRRVQLTPLQPGLLTLGTITVDAVVNFIRHAGVPTDTDAAYFLPGNRITREIQVQQLAETVEAVALPATGKPDDIIPPVGQFKIATKLTMGSGGSLHQLVVTVSGQGQWSQVQCPKIQWPQGLEVFETNAVESLDSQKMPVTGTRTYTIPFQSNQALQTTLPPLLFTFFNPHTQHYETSSSEALNVDLPATALPNAPGPTVPAKAEQDTTAVFTKWAPYAFVTIAMLLVALLWRNARKRKASTQLSGKNAEEDFDAPDISVGHLSKRLNTSTGSFIQNIEYTHQELLNETKELAIEYRQQLSEALQHLLPSAAHSDDPPYLRLVRSNMPGEQINKIMQFLETCDQIISGQGAQQLPDKEALTTSFYDVLRLVRMAAGH